MESTHVCPNGTRLMFNDKTRIVDMVYPSKRPGMRFFLNDADELKVHFDGIRALWQDFAQRQPVYWLIDYANFDVNPDIRDLYMARLTEIFRDMAIAVVRYNANLIQKTAVRYSAVKTQSQAHMYESRDEALRVLQDIKSGKVAPK